MSDFETRWRDLISGRQRAWWTPLACAGLRLLSGVYGMVVVGYRLGFDMRWLRTHSLPCAVIGVGNLTVGGTGKTTTVRWIVRRLRAQGLDTAVLSYGYRAAAEGDRNRVTVVAGPEGLRAGVDVSGDEPQMLARSLPGVPVLAGRKRARTGQQAWDEFHVDVCVLDDAFQYWKLQKDLEVVLVNAGNPFGHGHLLPRGMLREPLRALKRADAVLLTHATILSEEERERLREQLRRHNPNLVFAEARHAPTRLRELQFGTEAALEQLRRGRWLAVSGLGQPESFERTLAELEARDVESVRFPDHHRFTESEIKALVRRVQAEGWDGIVTTEKDAVKIRPEWTSGVTVWVLEVELELLRGEAELAALLCRRAGKRFASRDTAAVRR